MTERTHAVIRVAFLAFILLLSFTDAFASQITLKNGDRITGTITASGNDNLTVHTQLIGDIQIPWNAVEKVSIQENVSVPSAFQKGARKVQPPAPAKPSPDKAALRPSPPA